MTIAHFTLITNRLPGLLLYPVLPPCVGDPGQCLLLEPVQDENLLSTLYADRHDPGWAVESLCAGTPYQALRDDRSPAETLTTLETLCLAGMRP